MKITSLLLAASLALCATSIIAADNMVPPGAAQAIELKNPDDSLWAWKPTETPGVSVYTIWIQGGTNDWRRINLTNAVWGTSFLADITNAIPRTNFIAGATNRIKVTAWGWAQQNGTNIWSMSEPSEETIYVPIKPPGQIRLSVMIESATSIAGPWKEETAIVTNLTLIAGTGFYRARMGTLEAQ